MHMYMYASFRVKGKENETPRTALDETCGTIHRSNKMLPSGGCFAGHNISGRCICGCCPSLTRGCRVSLPGSQTRNSAKQSAPDRLQQQLLQQQAKTVALSTCTHRVSVSLVVGFVIVEGWSFMIEGRCLFRPHIAAHRQWLSIAGIGGFHRTAASIVAI